MTIFIKFSLGHVPLKLLKMLKVDSKFGEFSKPKKA